MKCKCNRCYKCFGYCCDEFYRALCTCHIKKQDKYYALVVEFAERDDYYKNIGYCPFCGNKLKYEED